MTAFAPSDKVSTPTVPEGWPIGSYDSYDEAQRAVDHLARKDFPVETLTIVGIDPMLVERVDGKLTWGRVLGAGAASGAWLGLMVGLLLSLVTEGGAGPPILIGLVTGLGFGMASAALKYRPAKGKRDFVSHSQLVARRYDVLSLPRTAEKGRDLLAQLVLAGPAKG
ncbi:general stress protein [Actinokineospora sp.]|uniref:general stress protein n=1 Tax=Actinokineospora sp. TaxID=1872133 RepID=UPI003D6A2321